MKTKANVFSSRVAGGFPPGGWNVFGHALFLSLRAARLPHVATKERITLNNAYRMATAFLVALTLAAAPASAQSFVVPPDSLPGGLSYQQWSARWWQWAASIPFDQNPILDPTGADCAINQSGPVWFLAGTSGFSTTRSCAVPAGKMIFFPIVNLLNDYPCLNLSDTPPKQRKSQDFQPGPGQSLEQFLTVGYGLFPGGARGAIDHVTSLSATLDGTPIQGLALPPENPPYRATSPMFEFNGDRSLQAFDPCMGPGHKGVSDGYWIMLNALSPGPHTLSFDATETYPNNPPFKVSVTYNIVVAK
jgi:hypothetical protein